MRSAMDAAAFRIGPGERVALSGRNPRHKAGLSEKEAAQAQTAENAEAIDILQDRLFAEGRRALLVILQGTDTSGKDGTIRKVFAETDPLGITVAAFGRPSEEE